VNVSVGKDDQIVRISLPRGRRTELASIDRSATVGVRAGTGLAGRPLRSRGAALRESGEAARDFAESRQRRAQRAGNFSAVGYQPVIGVLNDGVSMSASAVVSDDRRYVKISTVPVFTAITDVFTFSFINSGNPTGNPGVGGGN
jgi:hypothetical protein